MGEDLFWAIRGGGGASFGVIVAWKVQLVDVPERVTYSELQNMQNVTQIIHRWQYVAPKIDKDLFIRIIIFRVNTTIQANFFALFLGRVDIGANNPNGKTSYAQASIWGRKYFKNNFDHLVRVKTMVDPRNFFKNEQSIPPLHSKWAKKGD